MEKKSGLFVWGWGSEIGTGQITEASGTRAQPFKQTVAHTHHPRARTHFTTL